jgi:class 3 adenylate cyclase
MVLFETGDGKDHAAAALRAGLAIAAENRWLNSDTSYPWGDVHLHLGVNTGTALVGCTRIASPAGDRYIYTASGMVTVLASRIASLSSNSELYCGGRTMELAGDDFVAEFLGKKKVKNVEEEVSVFRVEYSTDT